MTTITEAIKQLKHGDITSVALIKESLKTIDEHVRNKGVAFTVIHHDSALKEAKVADERRSLGDASALLGIPISIKDSMDYKGEITTAGSIVFATNDAAQTDADVVTAVKNAGAIIVGRTNMSEFAFSGLGVNPHYGTPVHPDRPEFIAGGSTSGGAVSVASGAVFAALGSDTGGSLRIPAAFCDVVGFKPSANRISTKGVVPLSYTYDSVGAITRSVDDCILLDKVLSHENYVIRDLPLKNLRFFVTQDYVMEGVDEEVKQAFNSVLEKLKALGAIIIEGNFTELSEIPKINSKGGLTAAEIWHEHRDFFNDVKDQYDPLVAMRIARGEHLSAADYLSILRSRQAIIDIATDKLKYIDAWLMPTVAIKPPKLSDLKNEDEFFKFNNLVLRNTTVINFLDGCAISLPLGNGIGLSISGLNKEDTKILNIAKSIEKILQV